MEHPYTIGSIITGDGDEHIVEASSMVKFDCKDCEVQFTVRSEVGEVPEMVECPECGGMAVSEWESSDNS